MLFILGQIREAMKPAEPQAAFAPESIYVPDEEIEASIPKISEMAETIRRAAWAKAIELESIIAAKRSRSAWHRIKMMLNRRNHSSPT